jgi:hypothetical protein
MKPNFCNICQKEFKLQGELNLHCMEEHAEAKPVTCNFCQEVFQNKTGKFFFNSLQF